MYYKEYKKELNDIDIQQLREAAEEVEVDEVDNTEPTEIEKAFAKEIYDFISSIIDKESLNETFKDRTSLQQHFRKHCLANDESKESRRSNVYYDFRDIDKYSKLERELSNKIIAGDFIGIMDLSSVEEVLKGFYKLFQGSTNLVFSRDCGFVSNTGENVGLLFSSFATNYTNNYRAGNTIHFMMYTRYTLTLYPLDANYLENKFNSLVTRFNRIYNTPFRINR